MYQVLILLLDTSLKLHSITLDWLLLRSNSTLRVDALNVNDSLMDKAKIYFLIP